MHLAKYTLEKIVFEKSDRSGCNGLDPPVGFRLTNINAVAFLTYSIMKYIMYLDLHVIADLNSHLLPFLKFMSCPVIKMSHVPHFDSSHFDTFLIEGSDENSARVSNFLRFFGGRLLTIIFVLSSMDFIFDELFKNLRSCLIFPTICGFFGLCVITSGNVCNCRVD